MKGQCLLSDRSKLLFLVLFVFLWSSVAAGCEVLFLLL